MAEGTWIKMRGDLHLDPKVDAMAEFLAKRPEFAAWMLAPEGHGKLLKVALSLAGYVVVTRSAVVTGLLVTWSVTRRDGVADGDDIVVSHQTIDSISRTCGIPHLGEAMEHVGWAVREGVDSVRYPKALIHLTSPDERAKEQARIRQKNKRDRDRDSSRDKSRSSHADVTPRVEKNRTTTPIPPSGAFEAFWNAYPQRRRIAKAKCWARWKAGGFDSVADKIVAHVKASAGSADWMREGGQFVPNADTYLSQRRWEDGPARRLRDEFAGMVTG